MGWEVWENLDISKMGPQRMSVTHRYRYIIELIIRMAASTSFRPRMNSRGNVSPDGKDLLEGDHGAWLRERYRVNNRWKGDPFMRISYYWAEREGTGKGGEN